jgi:hypothetical protein
MFSMDKKGFPFSCRVFILCFMFASFIIPCREPEARESPGKLSSVHRELKGVENCAGCHTTKDWSVDIW